MEKGFRMLAAGNEPDFRTISELLPSSALDPGYALSKLNFQPGS